jgi:hypothetical protein
MIIRVTKDRPMRVISSVVPLVAGLLAGAISVLSCSDDSPGKADAATCDCPAAELPIAGRIVVVDQTRIIGPNSRSIEGAECPPGALRLSGSCTTALVNPVRDVTLEQSGFYDATDLRSWSCNFRNNEATSVTVKASVVCLMPGS